MRGKVKLKNIDDYAAMEVDVFLTSILYERIDVPFLEWVKLRKQIDELNAKLSKEL